MKLTVRNLDNQEVGDIELADEVFGLPVRGDILARVVNWPHNCYQYGRCDQTCGVGLSINGEHRDNTIHRAQSAVGAVQAALARRLSGGMQYLASVGSNGPFIGLFGTVYGIMNSFIGIANTNTTNLAVVAPGIAEALLATGLGLFAAIPSVIFYNYFQTRISAYGARTEGFVAELMNAISRQLDKGA